MLTETSSTDPGLLLPLCKCQCLTYVYNGYDTVKGARGQNMTNTLNKPLVI